MKGELISRLYKERMLNYTAALQLILEKIGILVLEFISFSENH